MRRPETADPMSDEARPRRRPETPDDAAFRLTLFRETHGSVLAGLDPALAETLLRHQLAGQTMSYASRYPGACTDILEHDGAPIGRMVVDETDAAITLVDIALLAAWRGRGIGTRLLRDLVETADRAGRRVELSVLRSNAGAMRLYERLGFVVTAADEIRCTMERRPVSAG